MESLQLFPKGLPNGISILLRRVSFDRVIKKIELGFCMSNKEERNLSP